MLFGVSGCGKSRTIFEVLSIRYGLYFEPFGGGPQPGSPEMHILEKEIRLKSDYDKENLRKVADHCIYTLLLTRLLIMFQCKEIAVKSNQKMKPRSWLFLQLQARQLLTDGSEVLFSKVFELLYKCHPEDVSAKLDDVLNEFMKDEFFQRPKSNLYVFMDEAHVLLKQCKYDFDSATDNDEKRSFFSHFFKSLSYLRNINVFLAGTALRLSESRELMKSCIGKTVYEEDMIFHKFWR